MAKNNKDLAFKPTKVALGYMMVGVISSFFGLSLQYYNGYRNLSFSQIYSQLSPSFPHIIYLLLIQITLTFLFSCCYTKVYFVDYRKQDCKIDSSIVFAVTISVIVIGAFIIAFVNSSFQSTMNSVVILCIILFTYVPISLFYLLYLKGKDNVQQARTKYILICPALLTVAANIFFSANICDGQENVFTYLPICLFWMIIPISFLLDIYIEKKKKETDANILRRYDGRLYYFSIGMLLFTTFLIKFIDIACVNSLFTPFKTMCLSVVVAIYLSIFESWYILDRKKLEINRNDIVKVINNILIWLPSLVMIFYPFMDFGLIFIVTFLVGHLILERYWFETVKPTFEANKNFEKVGVKRASLGFFVLSVLFMDKILFEIIKFKDFFCKPVNYLANNSWMALISSGVACVPLILSEFKGRKDILVSPYIKQAIGCGVAMTMIVLFYPSINLGENQLGTEKVVISLLFGLIIVFMGILIYYLGRQEKIDNGKEVKEKD